jgi:hypothetical protein
MITQALGLKSDHPLTAPGYSEHRSNLAKTFGLGRKPLPQEETPAVTPAPISTDADPKSAARRTWRRGTRSASKSDV